MSRLPWLAVLVLLAPLSTLSAQRAPHWAIGAVALAGGLDSFGSTYVGGALSRDVIRRNRWRVRLQASVLHKTQTDDTVCPALPGLACDFRHIGPMGSLEGVLTLGQASRHTLQRRYVLVGAGMQFTRWGKGSFVVPSQYSDNSPARRNFDGAGPAAAILEGGIGLHRGVGRGALRTELRLQHFEAKLRRGRAAVVGLSFVL